ncbi:hypothetical protein NKW54_08410 [Acetobacter cerevisiae]|uniref:SGNH hydrolase-type esterase domain-containing protein n=2 Tax=Acetobacter cerevisiae TaxID=178900 RepID=A0ABT1EU65_9PROT|nr:hypothetical protein [Acetobacter cerevisiae]MCP1245960.1 hypothetical protein [Acetobacter cerevisiae]
MSGSNTTSSGTPISDLPLASSIAPSDTLLGIVGGGTASGANAHQISVGTLGSAISSAAGIPDAVSSATQAATQADAAALKAYGAAGQAVQDKAGVAGGVAQLDNKAQLYLQGQSALAVTPATPVTSGAAATPAMLKPLLPMHPDAVVGGQDTPLGNAVKMAAGSVQAAGGDATNTTVTAEGGIVARTPGIRAADNIVVHDYGVGGVSAPSDVAGIIAADAQGAKTGGKILRVAPDVDVLGDASTALAAANHTVILGNKDQRILVAPRRAVHPDHYPSASMFPSTVKARHLTNFLTACIEASKTGGTVRIGVMGDSIMSIATCARTPIDLPWELLCDAVRKAWPNVNFETYNCAIGGMTWNSMNSDDTPPNPWNPGYADYTSWRKYVASLNLDLLLLYSGGNDGRGIDVTAMHDLVQFFEGQSHIPSIIFGVTYQPSLGSSTLDYWDVGIQEGIDFAAQYVRSYALANDYGYLDFGRWHAMCRDGFDPTVISLSRLAPNGTTLLDWGTPFNLAANQDYDFPDVMSVYNVNANYCTDWAVTFSLDPLPNVFDFQCSGAQPIWGQPGANPVFVLFNAGDNVVIRIQHPYGGTTDYDTGVPIPTVAAGAAWGLHMGVALKGTRLRMSMWSPQSGIPDPSTLEDNMWMEKGMITIFDRHIERCGAPYAPHFSFDGQAYKMAIHSLLVADSTKINPDQQRYKPIVTDNELYEFTDDHGGSDAYHLNSEGTRKILGPVIYAQDWAPDVAAAPQVASVAGRTGAVQLTAADLNPVDGWQNMGNVQAQSIKAGDYIAGAKSVTAWNAPALGEQPTITGSKPTDPIVQQLLAVVTNYGFAKDGTT